MLRFATSLLTLCALGAPLAAEAATRTVYFSQVARNTTTNGLGEAAVASATLIIRNLSNVVQNLSVTITASATGTSPGAGTFTATCNGSGISMSSGVAAACNSMGAAGAGAMVVQVSYPSYPTRASVTAGAQTITFQGSITATDATSNSGYVTAVATMKTFSESSQLQTSGVTGTAYFNGYAVYNTIPISINRGKPF